jgi:uncharacterized protein YbjT (DUF2867 family)
LTNISDQGSGNLGPAVLSELLNAGFRVKVITRQSSNNTFDSRAQIAKVDYESLESLKAALAGNEVVVNTLGVGTVPRDTHLRLVDAAAAAGVKRYLPSEYGANTTHPNTAKLPVFGDKIAVQQHLKDVSQQSGLTYSLLVNGPFLDWGLKTGFLLDLSSPVATLYDGGDRKFSATTLSGVGKAVVGIINNLSATENTAVFVHEAMVSQKEILALSGKSPATKSVQTSELEQEAFAELAKPAPDPLVFAFGFLRRVIFGEGFGSLFDSQKLSNDLFGLKTFSEEDLRGLISKITG